MKKSVLYSPLGPGIGLEMTEMVENVDFRFSMARYLGFKKTVPEMKHMFDSRNKRLIAETIFLNPDETFHLRGLAERTGVSPSTVSRLIDELEDRGIADVEKDLKMEIKAAETERFLDYKRSYNLWVLAETGIIDEIEEQAVPDAVVLFGSYARGEDKSESDIDIAVVNGREPEIDESKFRQDLGRKINIHIVRIEEADENFLETLANGIVLRGYLDV